MLRAKILYVLAWLAYALFCFALFPVWRNNVAIPAFVLVGLGAWLFGSTIALISILFGIVYHIILCDIVFLEYSEMYQDRLIAAIVTIGIVYLATTMRKTEDAITEITNQLDRTVQKRKEELSELTNTLIDSTERMRIEIGEELHNGIGQEMTGLQLYCSALAEHLVTEQNFSASLAFSLRSMAAQTHQLVRWITRTLYPAKIAETGLLPAVHELAAFINESMNVKLTIEGHGDLHNLTEQTALQLYRIIQETALYIIDHSDASRITLELEQTLGDKQIVITHNGSMPSCPTDNDIDVQLINYRLNQISGYLDTGITESNNNYFLYSIPT